MTEARFKAENVMNSDITTILDTIITLSEKKSEKPYIVAIDGRCAAGKTTLAAHFQQNIDCTVFHMDDFFLRPEQRTEERLSRPGENVDHERFASEVLEPVKGGASLIDYRAFSCREQILLPAAKIEVRDIVIVEGSYSCHPSLWDFYDLHIFIDLSSDEQIKRIIKRNGEEGSKMFKNRWIPLEEKYFEAYKIKSRCDQIITVAKNVQ